MASFIQKSDKKEQCKLWMEQTQKKPMVVFMLEHLAKAGCPIDNKKFFHCIECPTQTKGGFDPKHGVLMCYNHVHSSSDFEATVTHELIHAFDHCRAKMDWTDLKQHACSEIRASSLSTDCHWTREVSRGQTKLRAQHQVCVRRRATLSVEMNPNCKSREEAEKAVDDVWDVCFKDTAPFARIP